MKLLLQKTVPNLGEVGDVVEIPDGYGRNYLLPQRLAVANTPENRREIESQKLLDLQQEAQRKELAVRAAKDLKNARMQVNMKAQEDGTLYGSVTATVVSQAIQADKGYRIDDKWVQLDGPIKRIGDYDVPLKLPGREELVTFKLTVLPEGE